MNISPKDLLESVQNGGRRVIEARGYLNDINVFPVADSDTGNNMASLMRSLNEISVSATDSLSDVLLKISDKALEGAKGNSGLILAQFLSGIHYMYHKHQNLVLAISDAVDSAYQAVSNPQEGTMLSVMRAWATALNSKVALSREDLIGARDKAYESVQRTKEHKTMKRYNVVDAGAQGFYEFVDGITDSFLGIKTEITNDPKVNEVVINHEDHDTCPEYRYCLEVIVRTDHVDKEALHEFGDSVVVVEGSHQSKIHIHTNLVKSVVASLNTMGTVIKIKADDMHQQFFNSHTNKQKIAIVTDSIADIPQSVLNQFNIHVLPLTIMVDETEHLDKISIDNEMLLNLIDSKKHDISTSLPSQALLLRTIENLESSYESLVFISVASALSGTYQAIENAIRMYKGPLDLRVIDSKLNSVAQGLLVKTAAEAIEKGMQIDALVEFLEKERDLYKIYVSVSDLNAMVNSGRIPKFAGSVLQKINGRPIVSLDKDGNGSLSTLGFSSKQNHKHIRKKIGLDNVETLVIGYSSDDTVAKQWSQDYKGNGFELLEPVQTSAIIALSAGRGATAVAVKYRRNK